MKIKIDEIAFKEAIQDAMQDIARKYEREFEKLCLDYAGKPLDEVKTAIQQFFGSNGGTISDSELTSYSELISQGKKIQIKVK